MRRCLQRPTPSRVRTLCEVLESLGQVDAQVIGPRLGGRRGDGRWQRPQQHVGRHYEERSMRRPRRHSDDVGPASAASRCRHHRRHDTRPADASARHARQIIPRRVELRLCSAGQRSLAHVVRLGQRPRVRRGVPPPHDGGARPPAPRGVHLDGGEREHVVSLRVLVHLPHHLRPGAVVVFELEEEFSGAILALHIRCPHHQIRAVPVGSVMVAQQLIVRPDSQQLLSSRIRLPPHHSVGDQNPIETAVLPPVRGANDEAAVGQAREAHTILPEPAVAVVRHSQLAL
mmetsp:Transcript_22291/g.78122  ORF Transcript_22291/g.78122 Transcript_22291/m.78122 type:complete len:287 (-) Transcript_22291:813-1673(-)